MLAEAHGRKALVEAYGRKAKAYLLDMGTSTCFRKVWSNRDGAAARAASMFSQFGAPWRIAFALRIMLRSS